MRWVRPWNRGETGVPTDELVPDGDCQAARAALSAQLDGEPEPALTGPIIEHLADCAYCAAWQEAAHRLTRRVRLTSARTVPDRTPGLLAAVLADQTTTRRVGTRHRLVRFGLVAAAMGQLIVIIPALVFAQAGDLVPAHASRELGAFNVALAVGYLGAALRPTRARGALWFAVPATALLVILAVIDSVLGQTTLLAETPHLVAVAGWALLALLAKSTPQPSAREPAAASP